MSIYSMSFLIFLPFGNSYRTASKYLGVENSVFLSALLCCIASFVFRLKVPLIRQKLSEKNVVV